MELRQLRYLIGVHEAGGVLAASRTLHIAQPALSHNIAMIEEELGTRLFVRTNRGMTLTEDGRALVEHARVILADVERARNSVGKKEGRIRGEVSLGLPTTVALVATMPIFKATRERYPEIRLKIVESHSGFLGEWLRSGRLDLSVLFLPGNEGEFAQRQLLEERLALVTHPSEVPRTRGISLKQVAVRPMVLPAREHGLRRIVDDACARAGITLNVIAEIDSLPNIKKAVQAGMACTILSPGAVADEVRSGALSIATISNPFLPRAIACATSVARPATPATAAMVDLVHEQFHELVVGKSWPAKWIGAPVAGSGRG
jgi:LysR family transcriptional regulator, nitrogen assimilation regulatory protein